jgi:hypothetical protein
MCGLGDSELPARLPPETDRMAEAKRNKHVSKIRMIGQNGAEKVVKKTYMLPFRVYELFHPGKLHTDEQM